MDLHEIVENLKRMHTSASFTFLYAVEVIHKTYGRQVWMNNFVEQQKEVSDIWRWTTFKGAIRKWQRLIEEF